MPRKGGSNALFERTRKQRKTRGRRRERNKQSTPREKKR